MRARGRSTRALGRAPVSARTAQRRGAASTPQQPRRPAVENNPALEQKHGADWLLDLSGGWRHGPWTATVGVDNVTNRTPDKTTSAGNLNTNGIFPYSNFSPFGFDGREVWAKVAYAW